MHLTPAPINQNTAQVRSRHLASSSSAYVFTNVTFASAPVKQHPIGVSGVPYRAVPIRSWLSRPCRRDLSPQRLVYEAVEVGLAGRQSGRALVNLWTQSGGSRLVSGSGARAGVLRTVIRQRLTSVTWIQRWAGRRGLKRGRGSKQGSVEVRRG